MHGLILISSLKERERTFTETFVNKALGTCNQPLAPADSMQKIVFLISVVFKLDERR